MEFDVFDDGNDKVFSFNPVDQIMHRVYWNLTQLFIYLRLISGLFDLEW
jgi:hypothetical protein